MGDATPAAEHDNVLENSGSDIQNEKETTNSPASTIFPKITGKIGELIENYNFYLKYSHPPEEKSTVLQLSGTVKLHGTHADLVIYHDNKIRLQSRNRLNLSITHDNFDCAKHILPLRLEILKLRDQFAARYRELNGRESIQKEHPIIIAGEWIGPGIQKSVALARLPRKMFVILGASINDSWVPDEKYGHIHNEEVGIYNISRAGFYHEEIDINQPNLSMERMMELTLEVEKECPFAKTFGISGIGEGIVWKAAHPLGSNARYWFKTKGPLHRVSNTDSLVGNKKVATEDARATAKLFAEACVGEMRLEQGWNYLVEMAKERNKSEAWTFLKWLSDDVEVEERTRIDEMGVDRTLLRKAIAVIGREWYFRKVEEENPKILS